MHLSQNLSRLSLHDTHLLSYSKSNDSIILNFDWAKLENYKEAGIEEAVILGQTKLIINGVKDDILKAYYHEQEYKIIDFPENIELYWQEIANTTIDEQSKFMILDGMYSKAENHYWIEWSLTFDTIELICDSYISLKEWISGKLP